jgi:hypothetical protein
MRKPWRYCPLPPRLTGLCAFITLWPPFPFGCAIRPSALFSLVWPLLPARCDYGSLTVLVPSWSYESRSSAVAVFPFLLPIFARSIANLDARLRRRRVQRRLSRRRVLHGHSCSLLIATWAISKWESPATKARSSLTFLDEQSGSSFASFLCMARLGTDVHVPFSDL